VINSISQSGAANTRGVRRKNLAGFDRDFRFIGRKQILRGALVRLPSDSNVTFAIERAKQNSCPFNCHEIVISLVKGVM
jgi:hypothetical protein